MSLCGANEIKPCAAAHARWPLAPHTCHAIWLKSRVFIHLVKHLPALLALPEACTHVRVPLNLCACCHAYASCSASPYASVAGTQPTCKVSTFEGSRTSRPRPIR